jgi:hypothetical protein
MYPQKREIADIILAIPQKKSQKKIVGKKWYDPEILNF